MMPGSASDLFRGARCQPDTRMGAVPRRRVRGWKYIDLPEPELYRARRADPDERTNLVAREPERAARVADAAAPVQTTHSDLARTSWTRRRRRDCGRSDTSRGPRAPAAMYTLADDPKRLVALSELFNAALDDSQPWATPTPPLKNSRGSSPIAGLSGRSPQRRDRVDRSAAARPAAVGLLRDDSAGGSERESAWLTRMGQALAGTGATPVRHATCSSRPVTMARGDPEPLNELGVVLLRLGKADEARRAFEQLLRSGPDSHRDVVQPRAARTERTPRGDRGRRSLRPRRRNGLARTPMAGADWVRRSRQTIVQRAVEAWQRVIALDPRDFDTLYNLGMTCSRIGPPRRGAPVPAPLRRRGAARPLRQGPSARPRAARALDKPSVKARVAAAVLIAARLRAPPGGMSPASSAQDRICPPVRSVVTTCLLVTIDTLRVDRVGAYGNRTGLTPTIDRLAHRGPAFRLRPRTCAAHAARRTRRLMTSRIPPRHGVRDNGTYRLDAAHADAGGRAQAGRLSDGRVRRRVRARRALRARPWIRSFTMTNMASGQPLDASTSWNGLRKRSRRARAALDSRRCGGPWFAWVHVYDPHEPYAPPNRSRRAMRRRRTMARWRTLTAALGRMLDESAERRSARSHPRRRRVGSRRRPWRPRRANARPVCL